MILGFRRSHVRLAAACRDSDGARLRRKGTTRRFLTAPQTDEIFFIHATLKIPSRPTKQTPNPPCRAFSKLVTHTLSGDNEARRASAAGAATPQFRFGPIGTCRNAPSAGQAGRAREVRRVIEFRSDRAVTPARRARLANSKPQRSLRNRSGNLFICNNPICVSATIVAKMRPRNGRGAQPDLPPAPSRELCGP